MTARFQIRQTDRQWSLVDMAAAPGRHELCRYPAQAAAQAAARHLNRLFARTAS
jgi:hypothetical protein